jgi:STE24 endopeptidase
MKLLLFIAFLFTVAFSLWLRRLNLAHLKRYGHLVPAGFEGVVTPETLARSTAYTLETSRLGLWQSLYDDGLMLLFLFGGLLPLYDGCIASLTDSFVLRGVLFFLVLTWLQTLLDIPFSLYGTFRVESRHGFNTMTPRIWLTDFVKSQFIGSVLVALLAGAAFGLMQWSPERWWLWVWCFLALFSLFMLFISPYVIEPLFNRFEPVREEGLADDISAMMARAGLTVGSVMQMDASRRSRHSNAYFTGIGRVKRIVLFDTLLRQMGRGEIVAVLAHEIGHWKLGHVARRLVLAQAWALVGSWVAFRAVHWPGLPGLLGLEGGSVAARLVVAAFVGSLVMYPLSPLSAWLSRRDERRADDYACRITGTPGALASALVKLSAENLANLHPHPLYAAFHYSHPPVAERVAGLEARRGGGEGG